MKPTYEELEAELSRIKSELEELSNLWLHANAYEIYENLQRICEMIIENDEEGCWIP